MRNDLSRAGITVHQATPTCAFGDEITFRNAGDACSRWLRLEVLGGLLFVRLDAELADTFILDADSDARIEPCEAELMLF